MKKEIKVGLFQFDICWEDIPGNYGIIEKHVQNIKSLPNLLILPEMFTTGFTQNPKSLDKHMLEKHYNWQLDFSMNYRIHLMGTVVYFSDDKFYNRFIHTTPNGNVNTYDKRHLFQPGDEHKYFYPGQTRKVFDLEGIKFMPQICYDLRFPVWSRNNLGYHVLVYSSNWPISRKLAWDTLLRARAIENQCYVIGVNRLGTDRNDIEYFGGSSVYGPQGQLLLILNSDETYNEVVLSIDELEKYKTRFPFYKDADDFEIKNRD